MAKPDFIDLGDGQRADILYEDRAVLAIDKPAGWMLAPRGWERTGRNLQAALEAALAQGRFWARSRQLRFLRYVHRLDAETSGLLLLARSRGALTALSRCFANRQVEKTYFAVVQCVPRDEAWTATLPLGPDPACPGRVIVDPRRGEPAETRFRVLARRSPAENGGTVGLVEGRRAARVGASPGARLPGGSGTPSTAVAGELASPAPLPLALVEARPLTGRTHQIRVHLAAAGCPVLGDALYGPALAPAAPLALRAVALAYPDPFTRRPVRIQAPCREFCSAYGFAPP